MQDRVEAQRATVRADEVTIDTTQSVYRTAMEIFVANPLARKPEDITGTIAELRATYNIHHAQLLAMERDLSMMSATYQTATDAARKLIDRAHHHLMMNAADRFADQYEAAMRDAILADAALRELIGRAILEKDHVAVAYLNRAREGTRVRTPDEMMRHRSALRREANLVCEKFHHRSAVCGEKDD